MLVMKIDLNFTEVKIISLKILYTLCKYLKVQYINTILLTADVTLKFMLTIWQNYLLFLLKENFSYFGILLN